jgi:hypothetical protein
LLRLLHRELPEVPAAVLEAYAVKIRLKRAMAKRRQALQRTWLEMRDEALQWAVAQFQELQKVQMARLATMAEAELFHVRRAEVPKP